MIIWDWDFGSGLGLHIWIGDLDRGLRLGIEIGDWLVFGIENYYSGLEIGIKNKANRATTANRANKFFFLLPSLSIYVCLS